MGNKWIISLFAGAVLMAASSAKAQFWGSGWSGGPLPREGACFYQDANFGGPYFCVESGADVDTLPFDATDRVSSIRILGSAEVMVFQDSRFSGTSRRFTASVEDLERAGFNDQISSIQIRNLYSSTATDRPWGASSGEASLPRDGACFYEEPFYLGQYFCVEAGQSIDDMPSSTNDRVSSVRILGAAEITVYEQPRFYGDSRRFNASVQDLQTEAFGDRISSIEVRRTSSGSEYSGQTPGYQDPDAIVRRAYQDILEREPDPVGLRAYRSHIIDDKWTEQQVRDALRNSPEYREKSQMTPTKAQEIVRRAYLAVLNRAPDAASRGYVDRVLRDKWTQEDVERELRNSPEYRKR